MNIPTPAEMNLRKHKRADEIAEGVIAEILDAIEESESNTARVYGGKERPRLVVEVVCGKLRAAGWHVVYDVAEGYYCVCPVEPAK